MPRASIRSNQITGSSRRVAAARTAVARATNVIRARNQRLRRRNVRTAGFLGIEIKFSDQKYSGNIVTSSDASGMEADPATTNCLNAVAQGDGESQRDGKNYMVKSLYINGHITALAKTNQTALLENYPIMLAVVQDTQTNAAQLNSEDVFATLAATGYADLLFRNLQYSKRFKVLWKQVYQMEPPPASYDGTNIEIAGIKPINFTVALPRLNMSVETKGTTGNVTDIINNSLHFIAVQGPSGYTPVLTYASRIRFVG